MLEINFVEGEEFDTLNIRVSPGTSDIDALKEIAKRKIISGIYTMYLLKIEGDLSPLVLAGLIAKEDWEVLIPYTFAAYNNVIFYVNRLGKSREEDKGSHIYEIGDICA